ncbi:unnamed protein product [Rotaria sordida]|uniref:ABC transporter domain-containing protein n=1 Tax=Rotaria sordida TaxID=392033 RepID=A0A818YG25_9BILA|nr:unnamed protein product [Rotaria sordida]
MMAYNDGMNYISNLTVIRLTMDDGNLMNNQDPAWNTMRPISIPDEASEKIQASLPPQSSVSMISHQNRERNSVTDIDPFHRQLSILDPLSDRISTILVWKNLTVLTREDKVTEFCRRLKCWKKLTLKRKRLLNNISGAITGGLWAVMGPSGSGKSTLLNTLACRLDVNTIVQGQISLNGGPYDNAELKRIAGYVMQDDLLNGNLIVYETLMYTAELRLPRHTTRQQREARVKEVMFALGINHVKDVIVGTVLKKGISGGERKRLCVGMQLLNRPQLLFLDEPTSGLDSVTALDLIRTFHSLAHGQLPEKVVTIVCSIHQPQSKIFYLFDSLILLKQGNIIYQGPRQQAMDVYRMAGFPCPLYTNPADHLLDVITPMKTIDDQSGSFEKQANADKLILAIQAPIEIDLNMGAHKRIAQMANLPKNPLWITQFFILLRRNFQEQFRSSKIILTSIIQTIIIAVLIGCVFLQIGNGQTSIVRRSPVIFFCAINQGVFGALMVINSFPVERALSLRERASGTYYASAYFTAKILADTLVQAPIPVIFSCTVYFLVGFQMVASKFFIFTLIIILCSFAATSLALMISALCRTTAMSVTVLPMALEVTRLFGGFFLAPSRLPKYFSWLDALCYIKYVYVGLSLNELEGLKLTCTASEEASGRCITDGQATIQDLGLNYISIGGCIGALFAFIIGMRAIAFFGIRYLKH